MEMSTAGLEKLMTWEGCRQALYRDSGRKLTIGVGHLLTEEELASGLIQGKHSFKGRPLTRDECRDILSVDVARAESAVNKYVRVLINQNQFDTLVSFAFNVGVYAFERSTLLRKLNAQDRAAVPHELSRWNKVNKKVVLGLTNRRAAEAELWKSPIRDSVV